MLPMMSRLPVMLAAAVWLALATTDVLAAERFADPVGDVEGGAAPDITAVTVSHEAGRSVTFSVEFVEAPPLSWSDAEGYTDMLMILLDTDGPPASIEGAEYVVGVHAVTIDRGEFRSLRQGSGVSSQETVDVAVAGRTVSLSVPLSAIGNPVELSFWVGVGREAVQDGAGGGSDSFPASGMQPYSVTTTGTPITALALALAAVLAAVVGALIILRRAAGRRAAHVVGEDSEAS